jgi:hypothetical protein
VSNSRRGLLAAGLAVAVVGSMGVVWTLNANADEVPGVETAAAAVAPAADEATPVPPALLPWGARPQKLKRARAGASSAAVAAAGADAAPADTSGSLTPKPAFAPKGRAPHTDPPRKMRTSLVPPAPPALTAQAAADPPKVNVIYRYVTGYQFAETDGSWANLMIAKPHLAKDDHHTLAEIAVESADQKQTIEVGWTVDRKVNGDSDPHLFVFSWKDNKAGCYNACGFTVPGDTMPKPSIKPGDTLPYGKEKRFGIKHVGNAWWIAYNSEWIGYFPDSDWDGKYTRAGVVKWFGEVALASETSCTQMGNGLDASDENAATIDSISMTNGPPVQVQPKEPLSEGFSMQFVTETRLTFRYGGPVDAKKEPVSC